MNKKEQTTEGQVSKEKLILQAAEEEFLTKGFDGARTTSIAETAGVTHAMLHYYYRTKEQLFEHILNEKIALMASSITEVLGDPSLPVLERLEQGINRHFDFLIANPQLPRFVINEVIPYPERLKIMQNNILRISSAMFQQLQHDLNVSAAAGKTEAIDVRMLLIDLLSLNVLPFLIYPIVQHVFSDIAVDQDSFFEMRRAEAVETIMRRLIKQPAI